MIRASLPCLWLALAPALPAVAADFPLEDYVPADFHRRFLSVSPNLSLNLSGHEQEGPGTGYEASRADRGLGLGVNYGSSRQSQALRWDVSTGGGFHAHGEGDESDDRGTSSPANLSVYGHEGDSRSLGGNAFARLSGQWFVRERFFLGAAGTADFQLSPVGERNGSDWRLGPPTASGDTATFFASRSASESEDVFVQAGFRVAAGVGRIQDVTFAETGMFLLDRLAEATGNRLRLDKERMRDLEAFVEARRKRRPFYDSRRAATHDLESVDLFLREKAGMAALPARAVLEMADEWRHAGRMRRKSGHETRLFPFARASWRDYRSEYDRHEHVRAVPLDSARDPGKLVPGDAAPGAWAFQRNVRREYRGMSVLGVGLESAWHRPWRRFWQLDVEAWGRNALERVEAGERSRQDTGTAPAIPASETVEYLEYVHPRLEYGARCGAAWLPTSRTLLRANVEASFDLKLDYLDPSGVDHLFTHQPEQEALRETYRLGLNGEYHLSDRLTAFSWFQASFQRFDAKDEAEPGFDEYGNQATDREGSAIRLDLSAGLRYYLF